MTEMLQRHIAPHISQLLQYFPGVIIEGARQVGKSTLASTIAGSDAIITNLDLEQTRAAAAADPVGFVEQAGGGLLVIDEIQRLPELALAVKASIDNDRRPGRFLLTGSSSLLRVRGTSDSLAGRVARHNLYGLSRGEAYGVWDDFAAGVLSDVTKLPQVTSTWTRPDYAQMLAVGSFPEVRQMPAPIRRTWFESYLEGIVGRDLVELSREVRPARTTSILKALAGRPSGELVKAKLASETSVPARTITNYLDLLTDVGLIYNVAPWTPNITKREIGRVKTSVIDSGLALWLGRVSEQQLSRIENGEYFGSLLEAFVTMELLRQRGWSKVRYDIFHWRDRDGSEVDLVLELEDGQVIALEIKAASSFTAKQFQGLKKLRDALGDRFLAGIVLNTSQQGYRYADKLFGAPIASLWQFSD